MPNNKLSDLVVLRYPAEGVAEVRLNRPEKLNALSEEMYAALGACFKQTSDDRSVRAVILSAEGRGFCAGSDIGAMGERDMVDDRARLQRRHAVIQTLAAIEKPVVAVVRGPVAGIGFSLAMACDLIIASDTAYFTQAFKNLALVPDGGSVFFLRQRLGLGRAKDLIYTARKLPAAEALDWGLVKEVVADAALDDMALELAGELAASPTHTLALAKKMMAALDVPSLETALEVESFAASVSRLSDDHQEGVAAFRENRKPKFDGR